MEGDDRKSPEIALISYFNPLPPHGGRLGQQDRYRQDRYFNPLPPHGGRHLSRSVAVTARSFQSTPSAWRETLDSIPILYTSFPFQSTPSAWRETPGADLGRKNSRYFNPLPPHGGRHSSRNASSLAAIISIHSLRMEGDLIDSTSQTKIRRFQSTPSAWRETTPVNQFIRYQTFQSTPSAWRETTSESSESESPNISIHSLRMEGDRSRLLLDHVSGISIHSLRMEGDEFRLLLFPDRFISIHSLRMEGDPAGAVLPENLHISIHSLRMEGDLFGSLRSTAAPVFQSTPSAWRETVYNTQASLEDAFQSTPSAWRETRGSPGIPVPHWNFNPLPPHGGRLNSIRGQLISTIFQSTPSAWRETLLAVRIFQHQCISIHSLRMEGDFTLRIRQIGFYISIHSLRMEGDRSWRKNTSKHQLISIHSLRMEGDGLILDSGNAVGRFQSTPSAWRETIQFRQGIRHFRISIHSLRMEGD